MDWMLLPLRRYVDFEGRSRRKEYWMFALFQMLVYLVLGAIILGGIPWSEISQQANGSPEPEPGILLWVGLGLITLFWLFTVIPSIAVSVRRLHDQDLSGWFYLLVVIPYIGGLVLLVFMCIRGTRGPNRFGDDPKDPSHSAVFG